MNIDETISQKIALNLLKIKAISLNEKPIYNWTSNIKSPIYCDNRLILSYPNVRKYISNTIAYYIKDNIKTNIDCIAGIATGSIAISSLVADKLDKPFVYIRKSQKKHGTKKLVEGTFSPKDKLVLIEDLISTGKSSIKAFNALKDNDANVIKLISIFSYGFGSALNAIKQEGIEVHYLCDFKTLIKQAIENKYIPKDKLSFFQDWFENTDKYINDNLI